MKEIKDDRVAAVFNQYPEAFRLPLLQLRELIFETAEHMIMVGELEESLKWNQPTYSTKQSKTGTPIRLDRFGEEKIALFFHCQTTVIEEFKALFSDSLTFTKNRGIVLDPTQELPLKELSFCIQRALTYHKK